MHIKVHPEGILFIAIHIVTEKQIFSRNISPFSCIFSVHSLKYSGEEYYKNKAVHITSGIEASNMCRGCVAHPCSQVCPKGAISIIHGRSVIDQEKCIHCGKCKAVCPYDAISHKERPCSKACGVNAIESDSQGRAVINNDKCVSCGMCMVSCPFGAISDKSQIFQLAHAFQAGTSQRQTGIYRSLCFKETGSFPHRCTKRCGFCYHL